MGVRTVENNNHGKLSAEITCKLH